MYYHTIYNWFNDTYINITRRLPLADALQINKDDNINNNQQQGEHNHLKKCLGLGEIISFGVSNTVGSGIFVVIGSVAIQYSGSGLFISMFLAVLVSLLSAFCYAELSYKIPAAGQVYTYTYVCMGELIGFLSGWLTSVPYCFSSAAVARGWGGYVKSFIHALTGYTIPSVFYGGYSNNIISISLLGPILCILCTMISISGVKESASLSYIMACINCIVLVIISIYGVIRFGDSSNFGSYPWLSNTDNAIDGIGDVLRGSGLAFFSYVGWDAVCTLSEEVKDSKKDIPRGIMGTLLIVALLYVGLSLSFSLIIPVDSIDIKAPLAGAFQYHNDFYGYIAVSLAATTICIPSVMAGIVSQPRIWYRMALDGLLYDNFSKLNINDIPVVGTVVCGIMATILSAILRFDYLAGMVSLSSLLLLTLVCICVIIIRIDTIHNITPYPLAAYYIRISLVTYAFSSILLHYLIIPFGIYNKYVIIIGIINIITFIITIIIYNYGITKLPYIHEQLSALSNTPRDNNTRIPLLNDNITGYYTGASDSRSTTVDSEYDLAIRIHHWGGENEGFLCPWVPIIPLIGIWINSYLIASLGITAILLTLGWLSIGIILYVTYGQQHSLLND